MKGDLPSARNRLHFLSTGIIVVGPCHDKLFGSGGNGDEAIFWNRTYIFYSSTDPVLLIFSCFLTSTPDHMLYGIASL